MFGIAIRIFPKEMHCVIKHKYHIVLSNTNCSMELMVWGARPHAPRSLFSILTDLLIVLVCTLSIERSNRINQQPAGLTFDTVRMWWWQSIHFSFVFFFILLVHIFRTYYLAVWNLIFCIKLQVFAVDQSVTNLGTFCLLNLDGSVHVLLNDRIYHSRHSSFLLVWRFGQIYE